MKTLLILPGLLLSALLMAQSLPHGTVYGDKPNKVGLIPAAKLETFMGKRIRISTTISGRVIKVTKNKGGWFQIDAGQGRIIAAHFKNYKVSIPNSLKDRQVMIEGVAQKQFIADDLQHFAGDTVKGKHQHNVKTNPKQELTFEVKGMMVD